MTEAGKEIIEILKNKTEFTLSGNREFYEVLRCENGIIIDIYGETFGNIETQRTEISEAKALIKIKQYFRQHSKTYENKSISTDAEILEYWKRWEFEG